MKEKRLVAMFISSIVAFVASLSISIGVAVAFAQPVAATGLTELVYTPSVSEVQTSAQSFVFSPAEAFNGDIRDGVFVNAYDDVLWSSEKYVDAVSLVKIAIENNSDNQLSFQFATTLSANVAEASELVENTYIAFFDTSLDADMMYEHGIYKVAANATTDIIRIPAHTTGQFVMATYISDALTSIAWIKYGAEGDFANTYMTMNVQLSNMLFS